MDHGSWKGTRYEAAAERAWHLSLLIAGDLRAWSVTAMNDGSTVAMGWSNGLSALDAEELPASPVSVSFVTLPEWSALVPDGALEPGSEPRHLGLVHGGLPTGALRDEPVPDIGATCIYVHDDEHERQVLDRYPNARPVPMCTLMLRGALARSSQGATMLLHRSHDRLDAAIADRGRLLLSNTYPARSSQDMLYFALLAVDGCGLSPKEIRVEYSGTHLGTHEVSLLERYFAETKAASGAWSDGSNEPDRVRWVALTEQFACVS